MPRKALQGFSTGWHPLVPSTQSYKCLTLLPRFRREDGFEIRKRTDLVTLYNAVPNANKVQLGGAKAFPLDLTKSATYTTAEFYGCTVVITIDGKRVIIGHFAEEKGSCIAMTNRNIVENEISAKLLDAGLDDDHSADTNAWIITSSGTGTVGYSIIEEDFTNDDILAGNIHPFKYTATSAAADFSNSPRGKAVVEVVPNGSGATINLYIQSDTPSWSGNFDASGRLIPTTK